MVGYSEIVNVMAAMVLFSFTLLTANRMILLNSAKEVESEAEIAAINLAQNIIDEARLISFEDSESPVFGPEADEIASGSCSEDRSNFDDFDDYNGCELTFDIWGANSFQVKVSVKYVTKPVFNFEEGSTLIPTDYKKMRVTVTSEDYLTNSKNEPVPIKLESLRIYY